MIDVCKLEVWLAALALGRAAPSSRIPHSGRREQLQSISKLSRTGLLLALAVVSLMLTVGLHQQHRRYFLDLRRTSPRGPVKCHPLSPVRHGALLGRFASVRCIAHHIGAAHGDGRHLLTPDRQTRSMDGCVLRLLDA